TTGLTYGYQAGVIRSDNATTSVAAGTVALTASTTNYVEVTGAGVVSANTVGFTSGSFPLATVATGASSITTITDKRGFASVGGGAIGFSAYKGGTNQSVTKSSLVKITFNTTSFDTASEFDTTNSKWVPKSSGIKLITAAIVIVGSSAVAGESISLRLYKNGSQVANGGGIMCTNASDVGLSASFLQQANGTTDYFEVYTYWGGSGTGTVYGLLGTTSFAGAALK
ncbi:MAG: hypothetical protein KGI54_18940, partial [Pseudomonadota bacterium]|nr:hypothetical protein [Pseudomonadota bacterium]